MRVAERDGRADQDLVVAAQGGDRQALDELIAAYLPLVYKARRSGPCHRGQSSRT